MKKTLYTCPMHPEVQEKNPGKCSKCGMTLVQVEKEVKHEEMNGSDHLAHPASSGTTKTFQLPKELQNQDPKFIEQKLKVHPHIVNAKINRG